MVNGPFSGLGPADIDTIERLAEERGWVELKDGDPMEKVFEAQQILWLRWWHSGKSVLDICNEMDNRGFLVMPWNIVFTIETLADIMELTLRVDHGDLDMWRGVGL